MRLIFQLAFRNLWRQRRRNSIVLLAVILTIGGVLVMNSLARGMEYSFLNDSVEMLRGHIKIQSPKYDDEPGIQHLIPSTTSDIVSANPEVMAVSPRLRFPSVVMSERETRGATLVGVDPTMETHSFIRHLAIEGRTLSELDDASVLIGRELVNELETKLDRRIVLIFEGTNNDTVELGVKVQGIYDASSNALEKAFLLTNLDWLQELLNITDITEVSIYLQNEETVPLLTEKLKEDLPGVAVQPWYELDPFIGQMYQFVGFSIYILIVVFMFTLVFGLVNALVTAVLERSREFGLLRAVGVNSKMVVAQVVVECVCIMIVGLLLGLACGLIVYLMIEEGIDLSAYASGIEAFGMGVLMVPMLVAEDFVIITVASLVLGLIASYVPARRVIKTSILDSIRG